MAVTVVTDSTSDIDPALAERVGVTIVPLFVTFGDRSYRDYVDLSRSDFYKKLATEKTLPGTSQPTPAMFEEAFAQADGDIVCVTISSLLSGTINSARMAAQRFPERRIDVLDSRSASGGLALMVLQAVEMASAGAGSDAILADLDASLQRHRFLACIPDLSHLQRTGRIGRAQAALGTIMRVVPVLSVEEGQVIAKAQVRTFARAQEMMLDLALDGLAEPERARFIIMHANAPERAEENRKRLLQRFGNVRPRMLDVWEAGPVIATHGGAGAVGICVG